MIGEQTKAAILALMRVDPETTEAEVERVKLALTGARPRGATVRLRAAARILGVHRNTIANWARSGRLDPIRNATGRIVGVTELSMSRV